MKRIPLGAASIRNARTFESDRCGGSRRDKAKQSRDGRLNAYDTLDARKTALVVVDMQNYFVADGMPACAPQARTIVPNINRLAQATRRAGGTVIWIQTEALIADPHDRANRKEAMSATGWAKRQSLLAKGGDGFAIYPTCEALPEDQIAIKYRYSAFIPYPSQLDDLLRRRRAFDGKFPDDPRAGTLLWHLSPWELARLHRETSLTPGTSWSREPIARSFIVMADLCAFTSYVRDTREPTVIRRRLTEYYSLARHAVLNAGGMLYQFPVASAVAESAGLKHTMGAFRRVLARAKGRRPRRRPAVFRAASLV